MAKGDDSLSYALLRGSEQVIRVNLLQLVWRQTLGYLLHSRIPSSVTKVADVGTATGLWLCDLDTTRTDWELLDGYDISPASFLPPRDRPAKVTLDTLDATKDVPESLHGKYDVVHIRLIQPGIYDGDPSAVIAHCKDLLRPGGYLQWEEFDIEDIQVYVEEGVPRPSKLEQAVQTFSGGNSKGWVAKLPETLQTRGFELVAAERKREPIWHRSTMTHLVCGVLTEISRARLDVSGPPGAGEKLRAVIKDGLEENLRGSYITQTLQSVVARKLE